MTAAQFYEKLGEAGKRMVWYVSSEGNLRARFKYPKVERCFCPVTAVAYMVTRNYYETAFFEDAAEALGLNIDFANKVAESADNYSDGSKKVRRRLLHTVGVKE